MVVGFAHLYGYGLGDNVIAMEAIYALKNIYKDLDKTSQDKDLKVVLFAVGGAMRSLVSQVDFVDEYYELNGYLPAESIEIINKYHYDYLIITKSFSHILPLLPKLNAQKIIIACKGANIFLPLLPRYRNLSLVPMRNLLLQKCGIRAHCLKMVRAIKPRIYDCRIKTLDFSKSKVQTTPQNKQFVDKFLESNLGNTNDLDSSFDFGVASSVDLDTRHISPPAQKTALILVNPFNIMSRHTLSLQGYFELMRAICNLNTQNLNEGEGKNNDIDTTNEAKSTNTAKNPHYTNTAKNQSNATKLIPLVITYPKVHSDFMLEMEKQGDLAKSVLVFKNDDDLLNLAEMISRCAVVISPSTGVIHLASNLEIKTIGLYEKSESTKWRTKDENYVFLKNPKSNLSQTEENLAISQTIDLLKRLV